MPSWELRYIFYTKALLSRRFSQLPVRLDSPYLEPKWLLFWLEKALLCRGLAFKNEGPWNLTKKQSRNTFYNHHFGYTPFSLTAKAPEKCCVGRLWLCSFWDDEFSGAMLNWVVVSNIFYFHPYLGKISNLTNILQMGWNHQLVNFQAKSIPSISRFWSPKVPCNFPWKPTVECWTDRGYELGIYGTPEMEDAGMNLVQVILLLYSYYVFV